MVLYCRPGPGQGSVWLCCTVKREKKGGEGGHPGPFIPSHPIFHLLYSVCMYVLYIQIPEGTAIRLACRVRGCCPVQRQEQTYKVSCREGDPSLAKLGTSRRMMTFSDVHVIVRSLSSRFSIKPPYPSATCHPLATGEKGDDGLGRWCVCNSQQTENDDLTP